MKLPFPPQPSALFLSLLAIALGLVPAGAGAQPAPPPMAGPGAAQKETNPTGWTAKAGLSYVQTGGNAETSILGFKLNAVHNWTRTFFTLDAGGVRSDTTFKTSFGVGSLEDFTVVEQERNEKTAENYFADLSLDRNVTEKFFWQAGLGYLRNTFAGLDSRFAGRGGVGYVFTDPASKGVQVKGAGFLTLTHQDEVVEDPDTEDTFVGARLMADLVVPFGKNSFMSRVNFDENLQTTDDFRMSWWNSLGVTMTDRLGLQVSLLLLYDNLPALQPIEVYLSQAGGLPVGAPVGRGFTRYGKWDSQFAVSFVLDIVPKKPAPPVGGGKP